MATNPQEVVYWTNGQVWVTNQRIVSVDWNHWYNRIRKVRMERVDPGKRFGRWIPISLLLLICTLFVERLAAIEGYKGTGDTIGTFTDDMYWGLTIVALVAFVGSFFVLSKASKSAFYILKVYAQLPSDIALASVDKPYTEQILSEITRAMKDAKAKADDVPDPRQDSLAVSPGPSALNRPPVVVGNLVVAGDKVVPLSQVNSANVATYNTSPFLFNFVVFQMANLIFSLTEYAYRLTRLDLLNWLSSFMLFIMFLCLGWLFVGLSSLGQKVYTVNLRSAIGNMIAFATMNKDEANAVKDDVNRAVQNLSSPLRSQPSTTG